MTPDYSEAPQYHVLPKDDAEAVVDIMRAAAGLPRLYGKHDNEGGRTGEARHRAPRTPLSDLL